MKHINKVLFTCSYSEFGTPLRSSLDPYGHRWIKLALHSLHCNINHNILIIHPWNKCWNTYISNLHTTVVNEGDWIGMTTQKYYKSSPNFISISHTLLHRGCVFEVILLRPWKMHNAEVCAEESHTAPQQHSGIFKSLWTPCNGAHFEHAQNSAIW